MKINWKVRLKNKAFWLAVIPAVLLVAQIVTGWFGYNFAADLIGQEATKFVNAVFSVLVIFGIVNDPTTENMSDSKRAMSYHKPRGDL
ncbi:phage holin [Virgibacillus dakarensis]|nr:phage holin [Virgibacillus dakarensis]MBT2215891.1 phage holin [Virgibacillus dakarensis]